MTAQETPQAKSTEHILGTVSAVDTSAQTVNVKDDKDGTEHTVQLQSTKTLLKVAPGAKDLSSATRITAGDLTIGDRVDVRGSKAESGVNGIAARSVILMSGRDVQQMHQQETMAWQRSMAGVVTSVDSTGRKLMITARTPEGPKPMTVDAAQAQFTRYSPEHPQTPTSSQFADIQVGDQVKVLGDKDAENTSIAAKKVYSGSFRTIAGTVSSIAPDGKSMIVKDLTTKQPVQITLESDSAVRRLPPMMAAMLARRFNPDFKGAPPNGGPAGGNSVSEKDGQAPPTPAKQHADDSMPATGNNPPSPGSAGPGSGGYPHMRSGGNGDLSQALERIPKITVTDLKTGDAVVVSGAPSPADKAVVIASNVVAGVEPIFQSASPRQMQSLGDWGNSLNTGADSAMGQQP